MVIFPKYLLSVSQLAQKTELFFVFHLLCDFQMLHYIHVSNSTNRTRMPSCFIAGPSSGVRRLCWHRIFLCFSLLWPLCSNGRDEKNNMMIYRNTNLIMSNFALKLGKLHLFLSKKNVFKSSESGIISPD